MFAIDLHSPCFWFFVCGCKLQTTTPERVHRRIRSYSIISYHTLAKNASVFRKKVFVFSFFCKNTLLHGIEWEKRYGMIFVGSHKFLFLELLYLPNGKIQKLLKKSVKKRKKPLTSRYLFAIILYCIIIACSMPWGYSTVWNFRVVSSPIIYRMTKNTTESDKIRPGQTARRCCQSRLPTARKHPSFSAYRWAVWLQLWMEWLI